MRPSELGRRVDPRVIGRSPIFIATFSLLFILLGLSATAIGDVLIDNQPLLNKVAGVAIIAMGLLIEELPRDHLMLTVLGSASVDNGPQRLVGSRVALEVEVELDTDLAVVLTGSRHWHSVAFVRPTRGRV